MSDWIELELPIGRNLPPNGPAPFATDVVPPFDSLMRQACGVRMVQLQRHEERAEICPHHYRSFLRCTWSQLEAEQ